MDTVLSICMEMRAQIAAMAQKQISLEDKLTRQEEAIDSVTELSISAKETVIILSGIKTRLDKIESKFEIIEGRPLKHIQNITSQLISLVVAGAFGGITAILFH